MITPYREQYMRFSCLLERVTYKPGWRLIVERPDDHEVTIRLTVVMRVPDLSSKVRCGELAEFGYSAALPRTSPFDSHGIPDSRLVHEQPTVDYVEIQRTTTSSAQEMARMSDDMVLQYFVYQSILWMERHEIDEWLKLDGKCMKDPHPELRQVDITVHVQN